MSKENETLKITKKTQPVMFSIRVDKSIMDYYDELASKTNRSRNELISMALEFAIGKIEVE
ncbi:MAG: CopG family transcriptional regulator [Ruminococcaceae bacterium]|nr:CopG family transcriptional regulator [Oscillospiraceae bacterium]MBQ9913585.1 CopG family transcriptional regulator [Clostridia bacterium]